MENPEALLDFLTIRSWKERYHTDSETDESIKTLLTNDEEDLESFVRDFTIDDSISDCFAEDLDDKSSIVLKASDPPDLDFMYGRTFHSPSTIPRNFHNAAGSNHPQRFLTFDERRNTFPAFQKTKDSQPCEITIPSQDTLCFPVDQLNQSSHTVRRGQNNPGTVENCSTLKPSQNLDNKRDSEICFVPAVPFSSKITETGTKLDKVSNLCKQSKFGLKQVWSNTLKKCITKTDSIQTDDNDDSLFVNVKRFKTENIHVGPSNIPPALTSEHIQDFDDLCPIKLCTQLQGKSEPDLSCSKARITDNTDQKVFNRPSELLHSKSAEVSSDHLPNAAPQDTRTKQTVSSEHAQQNITPKHCFELRRNELEKNLHKLSYLTKSDNVADVSDNIGITDNGETVIKNKNMDGSSISPDMKIGLLDKINQALFQRTLVTLLKQSRCSRLLADILEILVNGKMLETLYAAVDQLKQLLYISSLPQDVSRLLELIHKNLENTFSQMTHLKATVEKLNIEMPLTIMPSDEQNREHEFQSRTLLADTYNIIKKHPPDLNDKIQDLISFHLKSKLLTLTSGQVSQLEPFTPVTLETLGPDTQAISKEHTFKMVLNSNKNYSHHNTSNFKGESLRSSSQDEQCRVVEDQHKPMAIQNRNIQLHRNSEIMYPCLSDYSSEKMMARESGHLSAPEHLHYKSARSHDCKCHQSSRHGHRCQEKRPDHCKHRHRDARRCRRKKRSVSDTRHTRRRHTISSFTTSSAYTPSITISAQSTDRHSHPRRRRGSHTFRSSSSSKSSRLRSNDYDDYWSDNESDDDDDDDESYAPLVRLNLDNEDLPDEALRIDRLHRHLESVQKLHQSSEDIIETIITGTGEKLVPHDRFATDTSYTRTLPLGHKESSDSWLIADQAEHSNSSPKPKSEGLKSSKLKVFKPRGLSAAQLFNHEKALLKNMRELTDSEFEETFERRHDINVKRRQQMDSEIPWDQLSFSESESDDQTVK